MCGSHIRVSTELNSFRSHTYGASHVITQRARRERVCIYPETRLIKVYLIIIILIHSFTLLSLYYINYDFVITLLFIYLHCYSYIYIHVCRSAYRYIHSRHASYSRSPSCHPKSGYHGRLPALHHHGRPTASLLAGRRSRRSLLLRDRAAD